MIRFCMRRKVFAGVLMACWAGTAAGGSEGTSNTLYGLDAGLLLNGTSGSNSFFGAYAGTSATTGTYNTALGIAAGYAIAAGQRNAIVGSYAGASAPFSRSSMLGAFAGTNSTGSGNVLLGYSAGTNVTESNRLYIDNCFKSQAGCNVPLVYGEFDNRLVRFDGVVHVTADRLESATRSQLHFSVNGADVGGWMTSAADNNFFTSSGARYDADAGGWIQRSPDGKSVISGSGAAGFRVLTSSGGAVGSVVYPIDRLHIDYDGLMGVNAPPVAGRAINTSTGAYLSTGGVWTNASSRALKENIRDLPAERALEAFHGLRPVMFEYTNETSGHVGFIAEDVPALVATADRKGLSPMDVVAVLTKVVQQQEAELALVKAQLRELAAEVRRTR